MEPSRSYRLSPLAETDMDEIWSYSATQWSSEQADIYVRIIVSAFSDLASGRRTGTPVAARQNYLRLLVGSHVVLYQVTKTTIDVIRVLHQSMDVRRHL